MRSDNNKKKDPNREIDDFLSKFEGDSDIESEALNSYLTDEDSPSPNQNFKWKEVKSALSDAQKKKPEDLKRQVTKEPADSAIKVERIKEESSQKPRIVAPLKSDLAEIPTDLDQEPSTPTEDFIEDITSDLDDLNDVKDLNEEKAKRPELNFKKILTLFSRSKEEEPVNLHKEDESFIEGLDDIDSDIAISYESADVNDNADEVDVYPETGSEPAAEVDFESEHEALLDADTDKDKGTDIDIETETETDIDYDPKAVTTAAAVTAFNLINNAKSLNTAQVSSYAVDPKTGLYYKVDPGKKKRVEFKDVPRLKKSKFALFGSRKTDKNQSDTEVAAATTAAATAADGVAIKKTLAQRLFCKKNKKYNPEEGSTYELNGKLVKNKPYVFSFLRLVRDFVIMGIIMMLGAAGVGAYVIHEAPAYDYSDIYATVATSSIVYDDQEKQIDTLYYTEDRRIVKYEDMPEELIEAVIAIEDKTFWKHHGFNWVRMIGAVFSSLTGHGQISGTSTITQQLSRNVYLPEEKSDRTIKRKFLEMYYAARLEHALSKEQIVEAYLNTIYLGYGCYGVNSAARVYFSKSVKDLDLVECAALAALPQMPHNYALLKNDTDGGEVSEDSKIIAKSPDRVVTNDISKDRRDLTLDLMLEQELITQEEYNASYDKALNDFINPTLRSGSGNYSYFHDYLIDTIIQDLMDQKNMSHDDAERTVYTGGLQIYSTLDSQAQNVVADEFKDDDNFPGISAIWKQDGDGNILNNDGKIALYDYEDYFDEDDNFTLYGDNEDIVFHSDGSATINSGHNLYIYETESNGETDYSIEFKNYYVLNDGVLYSIQGGYINIPAAYKSSDGDGNVKISADFFNEDQYKNSFIRDGNNLIIKDTGYSIAQQVRQPQGAMVIVEVGTGQVKAMVGGRQFKGQRLLNRATNSRQPGSSIKPLAVYGAALQKSYELEAEGKKWTYTDFKIDRQGTKGWGDYITAHSSIEDERTKIDGKYWPKNSSGGYSGTNNFRTAIQQSINTCAVKLLMQVSAEYAMAQVKKFGISTTVDVEDNEKVNDVNPAAMALGAMTEGVEPIEMALAYAAFPAGGKVNTPICYTKILDRNGDVLLEGKSEQTEALNEGVAWIMTDVLKSVVSRGIAYAASISDVQVGGKTGTTNDQYDIWFDGFTTSYAAALWIGTDNNIEMSSMSYAATVLWSRIMDQIPRAKEGEYAEKPDNVIEKWGEYYTEGTEVGLSSWSYAAEKKKARDAAYKKWSAERENHRHKVVDTPAQAITKHEDKVISIKDRRKYMKDGWTVSKETKSDGSVVYHAERDVDTGQKTEEKWHWEYDAGYRDGDFSYKFDGQTFTD